MSKEIKGIPSVEEVAARRKNFKAALSSVNKEALKNVESLKDEIAIATLGDSPHVDVERISSGSVVLDAVLGGGIGSGRLMEIYGPESSGKTSIALNAIADVQRKGGNAVFIDAEQALDPVYAGVLGVDTDNLAVSQLSIAEDVFSMCLDLMKSGTVDIIVIDSIAQLIPREEFENPGKVTMALMARIMSKYLRHLAVAANQHNVTLILLNQIREKVGVMFGNPETTPGGKALKFAASQRVEVRRVGVVKEDKEVIGTEVRLKVIKNKLGAPFQEGVTVLTFAKGINRSAEMLVIGEEFGIINKTGRTFTYKPEKPIEIIEDGMAEVLEDGTIKLATSQANAIIAIEENPPLFDVLAEEVLAELEVRRGGGTVATDIKKPEED